MKKVYLGDSVYAENDGYHIIIYTDNGMGRTNEIYLEPQVYSALVEYRNALIQSASPIPLSNKKEI